MLSNLLFFIAFIALGQTMTWFQLNSQFINPKYGTSNLWMLLAGIPISWLYMEATRHGVTYFTGNLWPQRLIGFSIGILVYAMLSFLVFNEKIDLKNAVCLILAFLIVLIQLFWKTGSTPTP